MYKLIVRGRANREAAEAAKYYEDKQHLLGQKFLDRLNERYQLLKQNPQAYSYVSRNYRGVKVEDFPYLVIYSIHSDKVVVFMVHSTYLKPRY